MHLHAQFEEPHSIRRREPVSCKRNSFSQLCGRNCFSKLVLLELLSSAQPRQFPRVFASRLPRPSKKIYFDLSSIYNIAIDVYQTPTFKACNRVCLYQNRLAVCLFSLFELPQGWPFNLFLCYEHGSYYLFPLCNVWTSDGSALVKLTCLTYEVFVFL